jgi:hypothetical protein
MEIRGRLFDHPFDMLVTERQVECSGCPAKLTRGDVVWFKPLDVQPMLAQGERPMTVPRVFILHCCDCAKRLLLPEYDAKMKAMRDEVQALVLKALREQN